MNTEPSNPFVSYTEAAREVVQLAYFEASRVGVECIEPLHVFLGLLRDGKGVVPEMLALAQASTDAIRREIEQLNGPIVPSTMTALPFSLATRNVLLGAVAESERAGSLLAEPQHIFLALLHDSGSPAATILAKYGVDLENARRMVDTMKLGDANRSI